MIKCTSFCNTSLFSVQRPFTLLWQAMSVLCTNVRQKEDGTGATCLQDSKDRSLGG